MLLVTLAGFCFCFVLAAAARWNDVDVIVNPTTACKALSLANGEGRVLNILCVATISAIVAMQIRRRHTGKNPNGTVPKCFGVIAQG